MKQAKGITNSRNPECRRSAIEFYALGALDLIQMGFAFGAHLVLGWIYLFISPLFLARTSPTEKRNPFAQGK